MHRRGLHCSRCAVDSRLYDTLLLCFLLVSGHHPLHKLLYVVVQWAVLVRLQQLLCLLLLLLWVCMLVLLLLLLLFYYCCSNTLLWLAG